jgi:hypothetical protein
VAGWEDLGPAIHAAFLDPQPQERFRRLRVGSREAQAVGAAGTDIAACTGTIRGCRGPLVFQKSPTDAGSAPIWGQGEDLEAF